MNDEQTILIHISKNKNNTFKHSPPDVVSTMCGVHFVISKALEMHSRYNKFESSWNSFLN